VGEEQPLLVGHGPVGQQNEVIDIPLPALPPPES